MDVREQLWAVSSLLPPLIQGIKLRSSNVCGRYSSRHILSSSSPFFLLFHGVISSQSVDLMSFIYHESHAFNTDVSFKFPITSYSVILYRCLTHTKNYTGPKIKPLIPFLLLLQGLKVSLYLISLPLRPCEKVKNLLDGF